MSMKVEREFQVGDVVRFLGHKVGESSIPIDGILIEALDSGNYRVKEIGGFEETWILRPSSLTLVSRKETEHKARPKDERTILDETQVFLDFVELEKLSISQLQDLREKELQRIAENEKLKNQIISDILSLRNIETNADFRRKRTWKQ